MKAVYYRIYITVLFVLTAITAHGYNMRQITTEDGLSNSAIISLYCDSEGLLWAGTCDGVNAYDGSAVYSARKLPEYAGISGNIIEHIFESQPGILWIQTNYGFNKVIPEKGILKVFPQFQGQEKIRVSPDGTVFALSENSRLSYYIENVTDDFRTARELPVPFSSIKEFSVSDNILRVFTAGGVLELPSQRNGETVSVGAPICIDRTPLAYAFNDGNTTLAVDSHGNVLEYTPGRKRPVYLCNIQEIIPQRGEISDILRDHNGNIFVSFFTDGVIKIYKNHSSTGMDRIEDMGIDVGVFCMEKSPSQNVIWIGTDCHGIYTCSEGQYTIQSINFHDLGNKITHPIRAVYLDQEKNLWIGTKGDGILKINGFNEFNGKEHGDSRLFSMSNSALASNCVFSFSGSARRVIWIATDEGLSYYSYATGEVHEVETGDMPVRRVYSVYEANDTTLLVSTNGFGIFTAKITGPSDRPELTDIRRHTIDNGNFSSNYFFSQAFDTRGEPLFCNRGFGAFVLHGDTLVPAATLRHDYGDKSISDVFAALRDDHALWLGTGHGLLKISNGDDRLFAGTESGFINNTIHAMQQDDDGNLWLSTNQGLIRFDPVTEKCNVFARNYGISVNEFSDGASFKTDNSLIFGGVDGIAIVTPNPEFTSSDKFMPELSVATLRIAGENMPLHQYLTTGSTPSLRLRHNQNYFSITFRSPDFINSGNYTYYYSLDDKVWINNGPVSTVSFTGLRYGNYTLRIKYVNRETGAESRPFILNITVDAPWYMSLWARIAYLLCFLAAAYLILRIYLRWSKARHAQALEKMEQIHKEEVYEEKLRFFTNITHEFCTPLTLIFGSCERLLAGNGTDAHTQKYIQLIQSNTDRLNSLIQDLIDFRRIETGHKSRSVKAIGISDLCNDIYRQFNVIAELNHVHFENEVTPDITFNTDYKAVLRIMSNLLSNAFKYTPTGGTVRLGLKESCGNLVISVYNSGKGISDADKERIFNRYSILDNVEENATKGISSRNGLGMAICSSLVEMLDGEIEITSELGKYALFTVTLPQLECTADDDRPLDIAMPKLTATDHIAESDAMRPLSDCEGKRNNILVIDDNSDILTLLSDSLSEYNVLTASDAAKGLAILQSGTIDLIITDVMMPGTDGVTLTRHIKGNKHTAHIPLIILSAKHTNAEKVEGLASGADAYVGKPFHLSYLRALIVRLLETRNRMHKYYNSSAIAFEFSNGQLVDRESKAFIDRIIEYIDSNIDDPELSTETISKHMQMSTRNLYRKFKELELPSPNDFIKQHRIAFAAKLLVTTSLTVQEIIFRCGFSNRSHFYREFDKQYGITPKDYRLSNKTKDAFDSSLGA